MKFENEAGFETHLRELIASEIVDSNHVILDYKTVADIIICRNGTKPGIFFIEVKYFQLSKGRLGFGNNKGSGIQPEVLVKKPIYLESNLRWLLSSDAHDGNGYWFVTSDVLREYVAGGNIGEKQNNIQEILFCEVGSLNKSELVMEMKNWLINT